jgi:hypothetical protein
MLDDNEDKKPEQAPEQESEQPKPAAPEPKPVIRANTNTFVDNKGMGSIKEGEIKITYETKAEKIEDNKKADDK